MQFSYRVTKYFTSTNGVTLVSAKNEWTSFSDVGLNVSIDNYLFIEELYLRVITSTCNYLHTEKLRVVDLECHSDNSVIVDNHCYAIKDAILIARQVLREEIWCKLTSADIEFHFGYDFYMYVVSNRDLSSFYDNEAFNKALNIEVFRSPYI